MMMMMMMVMMFFMTLMIFLMMKTTTTQNSSGQSQDHPLVQICNFNLIHPLNDEFNDHGVNTDNVNM